jgi:5'-nucleotidase
MHILVTNDDGVTSPGLLALVQSLAPQNKITVFTPDRNWSASGHVKTLDRPLRVKETHLADGFPALTTDGAPSDCVALALLGVIPDAVDLVVSGINPGENVGHDMTYSGTVTAAMEAVIGGIPAIAISLQVANPAPQSLDFSAAAHFAREIVQRVQRFGLPVGALLNVNVPPLPLDAIQGIQITRLGQRLYLDKLVSRLDPRNRPYYWIGGEPPSGVPDEGTDFGALARGFVSITPLQLDLTDHHLLEPLRKWDWV